MSNAQGYDTFIDKKLDDDEIRVVSAFLLAFIDTMSDESPTKDDMTEVLDTIANDFKEKRDNFNHNVNKILEVIERKRKKINDETV